MSDLRLSPRTKSIPPRFWNRPAAEVAGERHRIDVFTTPVLALDESAEGHNIRRMFAWAEDAGVELAPHGKTTMSPRLWRHLTEAGAAAISVATPWQAQLARSEGVRHVLLASELLDPAAATWLARELDDDAGFRFSCFVDSQEGLDVLLATRGDRPFDVLIELGEPGGRTGRRSSDEALALAWAAARATRVRLHGIAGYEGSLVAERTPETEATVRAYLGRLVELFETLESFELFDADRPPVISAGGSIWFDVVADVLAPLRDRARIVLRPGSFVAQDDGVWDAQSPLGRGSAAAGEAEGEADGHAEAAPTESETGTGTGFDPETDAEPADEPDATPASTGPFRPALRLWTRVISRPEKGLALLDAGKRDVPSDLGFPVALAEDGTALPGHEVTRLDDQHAYLRIPEDSALKPGDVVRLGISHPCGAFDRWRVIPVVDDANTANPRVVGFVETSF
ncbi:alanine racemase [Schumannella sp. 10F1B-5-1]|uniref:alanine racemase n=1 Tax=Schumannella sp. 10F1B-5-1 TaxID=2590780 RepID=UPI001131B617|nr:alanine racemase [Schumannella sp. 10F1B-5-1]TPW73607.1 amino acid deaminase [Schumannella sp. 10F1B-5-1]